MYDNLLIYMVICLNKNVNFITFQVTTYDGGEV